MGKREKEEGIKARAVVERDDDIDDITNKVKKWSPDSCKEEQ